MQTLGECLKQLRLKHNLSTRDVENTFKVFRSNLSKFEAGTLYPSRNELQRLAVAYGIQYKDLIFRCIIEKAIKELIAEGFSECNISDYNYVFNAFLKDRLDGKSKK